MRTRYGAERCRAETKSCSARVAQTSSATCASSIAAICSRSSARYCSRKPQAQLARERIEAAGLSDRIEVRVSDYREITDGPFDKIASVGMYEHVGRDQLDPYAHTLHDLLAPGGLFLNHGIARLHSDPPPPDTFLTRYVFPDGELHPVTDVMTSIEDAGLEVRDVESLREHYPLTLRAWLANLEANQTGAIAEIGAERERVWRLYMLASALGFEAGDVTVYQVLGTRPDAPHGLPLTRSVEAATGALVY